MEAEFTIIIPIYNAEKFLSNTLRSILMQTYSSYEVIMVDDGSTDSSVRISEEFTVQDSRFFLYKKENGGVSSARNLGIEKARGKYVMFMDSDDTIEPHTLFECHNILQKSDYDMLLFGMYFDVEKNAESVKSIVKSYGPAEIEENNLDQHYRNLYSQNYLTSMCNRVVKYSLIKENSLTFDIRITNYEDMIFGLHCLKHAKKIFASDRCYYHYIFRDELGMSRKYKPQLTKSLEVTVKELKESINGIKLCENMKEWALRDIQKILWMGLANICRSDAGFWKKREKIKSLCVEKWVSSEVILKKTGNRYNDICLFFLKHQMWSAQTLWNMFANWLRDKRY